MRGRPFEDLPSGLWTALECTAGNGGNEIRDWLAVAGAMPEHLRARVLAYEPVQEWVTGTGVMAWAAA